MNRLAGEKSPYLLQHAHNPVDWMPWGEEAFAEARRTNKPIFLSIGYSTCHWCHVMARESFENPEIAALMNRWFVNIKVDREERPDVDRLYMAFVQASTGSGGWPMSVWLTPDGKPFLGGTYFPPENRYGRAGFPTVLTRIAEAWEKDPQRLITQGQRVIEALREAAQISSSSELPGPDTLHAALQSFSRAFDPLHAGFGGAPKFPRPVTLHFLLQMAVDKTQENSTRASDMLRRTLTAMAAGGMYDQLGGGFHRYSVDEFWHVPHFEKMLYDQGQLAAVYAQAALLPDGADFLHIARDICDYLANDLHHPDGAFFSAEDADSAISHDNPHHAEGAFYVWTSEEIARTLPAEDAAAFAEAFGIEPQGNVRPESDPHGEFTGKNVLYQVSPTSATRELLLRCRPALLAARAKRPRPHCDDKILAAWNGHAITGLVRTAMASDPGNPDGKYAQLAIRAAQFLLTHLRDKNGALLRVWRDGSAGGIPAFAEDYAFVIQALLDLHELTLDPAWVASADALQEIMNRTFWDEAGGAYFDNADTDPHVLVRMKEDHDGAEPCANSVAARNLLRLSRMLHREEDETRARRILQTHALRLRETGYSLPEMLCALDFALYPPAQIVITGDPSAPDTRSLLTEVHRHFLPHFVICGNLPSTQDKTPVNGRAAAYVCRDFACQTPVTDPSALRELIRSATP